MTGDGGGGGDGLPSNHPSKVAWLTPYRSETNKDTSTIGIWVRVNISWEGAGKIKATWITLESENPGKKRLL